MIYNQGTIQSYNQCVKNSGHYGQLDAVDKPVTREHQNLYQCVKNPRHCGQLDAVDKSVTREDQLLISVSKSADIVDNWTQEKNLQQGKIRYLLVCQNQRTLWTTGRRGQICNKGRSDPYQCVKISGQCGQLDARDKSIIREHQNPYQCVKNCGHCEQLDAKDKSITTDHQNSYRLSKTEDIVDNWTQWTNLEPVHCRIPMSVSKTVDIVNKWTQRTNQ